MHLGHDERAADGGRNFARALCVKSNIEKSNSERASTASTASAFQSFLVSAPNPTLPEADVAVEIAHGDVGLEARALAGRGAAATTRAPPERADGEQSKSRERTAHAVSRSPAGVCGGVRNWRSR